MPPLCLLTCSKVVYTYEPSLTRRAAVGKLPIPEDDVKADVKTVLSAKLLGMLEDVEWVQEHMARLKKLPEYKIVPDTIFSASRFVRRKGFVDVVITSPPYLNNYHYPRNTRPQIHWLGFSNQRGYGDANESKSFGKFWQTVRDLPPVKLKFKMQELSDVIGFVREANVGKGQYGGPGWANYIATYFNDTHRFCKSLRRLLKPGGVAVIVLGNSIIQGVEVRTDQIFGQIAALCGLYLVENNGRGERI